MQNAGDTGRLCNPNELSELIDQPRRAGAGQRAGRHFRRGDVPSMDGAEQPFVSQDNRVEVEKHGVH